MGRKSLLALLLCVILVFATACELPGLQAEPKTFSKSGLSIELTDAFSENEHITYTAYYASQKIAVFTLKEEFTLFGTDEYTLDEYAQLVLDGNKKEAEIVHEDGLTYFVFNNTANGKDFTYLACVYKGTDAYWLVQFACNASEYETLKPTLIGYAASVTV